MFHSIKGTIPLRLSGVSYVDLIDVKIDQIANTSEFGSKLCGNYRDTTSFKNSKPGFLGADIRGITIESCREVNFKDVDVQNLKSLHGTVIGVELFNKNSAIKGNINVQNLKTIYWKNLPEDFNLIPQSTPFTNPLQISNYSFASISLNKKKSGKILKDNHKIKKFLHNNHPVHYKQKIIPKITTEPKPCHKKPIKHYIAPISNIKKPVNPYKKPLNYNKEPIIHYKKIKSHNHRNQIYYDEPVIVHHRKPVIQYNEISNKNRHHHYDKDHSYRMDDFDFEEQENNFENF